MAPSLQLWYSPGACSLAPHIILHETQLPFTLTNQKIRPGKPSQPESFRAINPKMLVPVLRLDDQLITEVPAIFTALSSLVPEKHLMGKSLIETVRVYEWLNWLSGAVHGQGYGPLWRPERFSDDEGAHEALRKAGRQTILRCYGYIEGKLDGSGYAVGGYLTVVDAFLLVFWRWGKRVGIEMEQYPKFGRLAAGVAARESTREAYREEGIGEKI